MSCTTCRKCVVALSCTFDIFGSKQTKTWKKLLTERDNSRDKELVMC